MNKKRFYLSAIILSTSMCIRFGPGRPTVEGGPYIDSLGLRASLARIDNVEDQSAGTLIKQALEVPENAADDSTRPDFFQSLEDDYQRYLKLFALKKAGKTPEVGSDYDLLETFRSKVFDPQPFMNAILHTLTLREITTLDYAIQSDKSDTLLIQVTWAKATPEKRNKSFGITEGTLPLMVTKHSVFPEGPLPENLRKK